MNAQREASPALVTAEPRESLGDLLGDLMTQSSDLVKGEVALAKAELNERARQYSSAAMITAIGVGFGLLAGMALLTAGIFALSIYTGLIIASLLFGAALTLVAALLVTQGLRDFKRSSPSNSVGFKPTPKEAA